MSEKLSKRPEGIVKRCELGSSLPLAADLNLFLFDRGLHPELFRHYANYRVNQVRYHADIWFVGLSHVVTVTSGQRSLTELVCVDSDMLPARGILTRFRMKGERDLERRSPDGWHYMVSSQVETMDDALFKSVHFDLFKHAQKRGWSASFEAWADGDMIPFSYIDHEAWDGQFHVHAFHSFPSERTVVKTQTIFELPPA
ncbi:MAG: DUF2617 family protein [Planctomycetes bacterium]|nr:DUF2617 family protein [Planctomycetota bacterium]